MYDRVLLPTDGSDGAAVATEHAFEFARQFDAPVYAFYVVDPTVEATDAYDSSIAVEEVAARRGVDLEAISDRADQAGLTASTAVLEGQPAETIVDGARAGDVVVLGTHGRTGLDRYLLGSTTELVVRNADVPVVAVPVSPADGEES